MKAIFLVVILTFFLPAPILRGAGPVRMHEGVDIQKAIPAGDLRGNILEPTTIRLAGRSGPVRAPDKDSQRKSSVHPGKTASPVKVEDLSGRLVERGKRKKKDK
jgi:hypothetical protein